MMVPFFQGRGLLLAWQEEKAFVVGYGQISWIIDI